MVRAGDGGLCIRGLRQRACAPRLRNEQLAARAGLFKLLRQLVERVLQRLHLQRLVGHLLAETFRHLLVMQAAFNGGARPVVLLFAHGHLRFAAPVGNFLLVLFLLFLQQMLEKKEKENEEKISDWGRKAEMAVGKKQDDRARAAIERSLHYKQMSESFRQQVADQTLQVETLKNALNKLTQKLEEARARSELRISQSRRARTLTKAADAQSAVSGTDHGATFDRMRHKVMRQDAIGQAKTELLSSEAATVEDRFAQMEKEDEINRILGELKSKRA